MEALNRNMILDGQDKALFQKDITEIHYLPKMWGANADAMASQLQKSGRDGPTAPKVTAVPVGRKLFFPVLSTTALASLVICTEVVHVKEHYFL